MANLMTETSTRPPGMRRSLCEGLDGLYSIGLHVTALFIVLAASIIGTVIPIVTKFIPFLRTNPFIFVIAKTAATGVLLSVSCIHLLQEGVDAFREPCVNRDFVNAYGAYAMLFAILAALLMHFVDFQLSQIAERWMKRQQKKDLEQRQQQEHQEQEYHQESGYPEGQLEALGSGGVQSENEEEGELSDSTRGVYSQAMGSASRECHACCAMGDEPCEVGELTRQGTEDEVRGKQAGSPKKAEVHHVQVPMSLDGEPCAGEHDAACDKMEDSDTTSHDHSHPHADFPGCGHSHEIIVPTDMSMLRRIVAAVCMEFGVTLHSVFVGLDIGLTTDKDLKPLLVALVFHQLFEGMALGSRLVDTNFKLALEFILATVFSVSAPIGIAIAIIAVAVSGQAMSGGGFVTMMGVLDSLCGGILLYLAFTLLLIDFSADMKQYCTDGVPHAKWKRYGMFATLWLGMASMAIVGKWV